MTSRRRPLAGSMVLLLGLSLIALAVLSGGACAVGGAYGRSCNVLGAVVFGVLVGSVGGWLCVVGVMVWRNSPPIKSANDGDSIRRVLGGGR